MMRTPRWTWWMPAVAGALMTLAACSLSSRKAPAEALSGQESPKLGKASSGPAPAGATPSSVPVLAPLVDRTGKKDAPVRKQHASVVRSPRGENFKSVAGADFGNELGGLREADGRTEARPEGPFPDMYFTHFGVNPTVETAEEPLSSFSVDVDTASYTLARSYLARGAMPEEAAVRVEEFVNAFDYGYRAPEREAFAVSVESFPSPYRKGFHLLHLGVKGKEISAAERKAANLIFAIDVSGSMGQENRLGLVKRALTLLVEQLTERDQVGIVVYGTDARDVLPLTNATQKERILEAIARLSPEGSTNVQAGLKRAYGMAWRNLRPGQVNRVILCSDGVANNGIVEADAIFRTVKDEAEQGITLTTVGFGMGNYNDRLMERLADTGNGQYAYVDRLDEARRLFVEQLTGTLQVIAKDVKLQLQFDPTQVVRYRLIGFENRVLSTQQFHDDAVDAGEIGAGHQVTAVYEVKFRELAAAKERRTAFATLRVRYKEPDGRTSRLVEKALPTAIVRDRFEGTAGPARLSMIVAGFGEKLRGSYWARALSYDQLLGMWAELPAGLRERKDVGELRELLQKARALDQRGDKFERELPLAMMDFDRIPVLR